MAICVCGGAMLQCSFGVAPSTFMPKPKKELVASMPGANIMDNIPMTNIMPFGMCNSMANPQVAAATAAALGVLTPMPCVPVIAAPWTPGSATVLFENFPALNNTSKLMCNWAGIIQIINPGNFTVQIP